ncbi:MAG: sugar ABC transporter permease [Nocardiopsaceae bacterium]|jgi:ABC-type sugar transport system permease subunit|nr:sugar ABC transporter permease [Nocardiopsaceae bacterium]
MQAALPKATGRVRRRRQRTRWFDWMTAPALIVLAVVVGYPIVDAVLVSFTNYSLYTPLHHYVGGVNYSHLSNDPVFWKSLQNTVIFTGVSVAVGLLLGLGLALALERLRGPWRFLRAILLTPWAVPVIVTAFLFEFMFTNPGGIINSLLETAGLIHSPLPWLTSPTWALTAVIIANVWMQAPFFLLIFTAALGGVPDEVIEAARIDRARTWSMIALIKLPYLRNAALVGALLMIIQNFNNFPLIWAMTTGGPAYGTSTLVIYVYQLAFTSFKLGYASAVGVVWLVLLMIITSLFIRTLRSRPA